MEKISKWIVDKYYPVVCLKNWHTFLHQNRNYCNRKNLEYLSFSPLYLLGNGTNGLNLTKPTKDKKKNYCKISIKIPSLRR